MREPRARVMAPRRYRTLLTAAAAEFARAGYQRASLNKVIAACGLSKSSFYHYFASKQALFDAVVTESGAALVAALDVPDPESLETGFWEAASELVRRLASLSVSQPWSVDLGRLFYLDDAPAGAVGQALDAVNGWLTAALAAGRRGGSVRADLPAPLQAHLAIAVLRAMDEWTLRSTDQLAETEMLDVVDAQLDALRRLLAP
jgi:AcrR family transcriptional regulator